MAEVCEGAGNVEVSSHLSASLFKGSPLKAEYEDGSGSCLNGFLKEGLFLGYFSGKTEDYCFVEKVRGGGQACLGW